MAERNDTAHKVAEVLRAAAGKTGKKYYTSAVILAAGSSTRMGGDSTKQFFELCGMPVVARTIIEFEKSPLIDEIIVVAKSDEISKYDGFVEAYGITKPFKVIEGGETRPQETVLMQLTISRNISQYTTRQDVLLREI